MTKKIFSILLGIFLVLSLASCGESSESDESSSSAAGEVLNYSVEISDDMKEALVKNGEEVLVSIAVDDFIAESEELIFNHLLLATQTILDIRIAQSDSTRDFCFLYDIENKETLFSTDYKAEVIKVSDENRFYIAERDDESLQNIVYLSFVEDGVKYQELEGSGGATISDILLSDDKSVMAVYNSREININLYDLTGMGELVDSKPIVASNRIGDNFIFSDIAEFRLLGGASNDTLRLKINGENSIWKGEIFEQSDVSSYETPIISEDKREVSVSGVSISIDDIYNGEITGEISNCRYFSSDILLISIRDTTGLYPFEAMAKGEFLYQDIYYSLSSNSIIYTIDGQYYSTDLLENGVIYLNGPNLPNFNSQSRYIYMKDGKFIAEEIDLYVLNVIISEDKNYLANYDYESNLVTVYNMKDGMEIVEVIDISDIMTENSYIMFAEDAYFTEDNEMIVGGLIIEDVFFDIK